MALDVFNGAFDRMVAALPRWRVALHADLGKVHERDGARHFGDVGVNSLDQCV